MDRLGFHTGMRAWVPREWNEIRRPENAAFDCRSFTAAPDTERTHLFEARPPGGDRHPSAFLGWIECHVGTPPRTYEVSIRSTNGTASRSYVLLAPTLPIHFGPDGPACVLVCLGRAPDRFGRANSDSSCGTAS